MKDGKYILAKFDIENIATLDRVVSFSIYDDYHGAWASFDTIRRGLVDHRKMAYAIFGPFSLTAEMKLDRNKMITSTVTPDGHNTTPKKVHGDSLHRVVASPPAPYDG